MIRGLRCACPRLFTGRRYRGCNGDRAADVAQSILKLASSFELASSKSRAAPSPQRHRDRLLHGDRNLGEQEANMMRRQPFAEVLIAVKQNLVDDCAHLMCLPGFRQFLGGVSPRAAAAICTPRILLADSLGSTRQGAAHSAESIGSINCSSLLSAES
jgi:hypothetical protein